MSSVRKVMWCAPSTSCTARVPLTSYSPSPAALRATARSVNHSNRSAFPSRNVTTCQKLQETPAPLALPRTAALTHAAILSFPASMSSPNE